MLYKIWKSLIFCAFLFLINKIMFGGSNGKATDTFVGKIILGGKTINNYNAQLNPSIEYKILGEEIVNLTFGADIKMGIKSKSNVLGQMFDYLRFSGTYIFILLFSILFYRSRFSSFSENF